MQQLNPWEKTKKVIILKQDVSGGFFEHEPACQLEHQTQGDKTPCVRGFLKKGGGGTQSYLSFFLESEHKNV